MNLFDLLKEHADMSKEEAEHYFRIENTASEWTLKSILYLEPTKFHAVLRLAYEYGGTYDPKLKGGVIHIPKEVAGTATGLILNPIMGLHSKPSHKADVRVESTEKLEEALGHVPEKAANCPATYKESGNALPTETSEEYALSRSLKGKLGQLVPCLESADGIVFDGLHRKKVDPNAWTVKVDRVKTPVDRALARMTVNFCRRHYTSEEMRDDIGLLIASGLTVEQIIESTGISESTIYKYKPQELKDQVRVEAGKEAHRISQDIAPSSEVTVKTQDTAQPNIATPQFIPSAQGYIATELRSCEKCGMPVHRTKMSLVDGKLVCPKCAGVAEPAAKPEFTKLPAMPKDAWTFRRAQMSPQHSSMEMAVLQRLNGKGVQVMTDFEFCLQKTTPDFWFPDKRTAVYLDGPVHQGREDRDELLRELLRKRHGVNVVSIPYVADTETERERVFGVVMEAVKA
jgi:very-short-patch-repair endonuclease